MEELFKEIKTLFVVNEGNSGIKLISFFNKKNSIRITNVVRNIMEAIQSINIEIPDIVILEVAFSENEILLLINQLQKKNFSNTDIIYIYNKGQILNIKKSFIHIMFDPFNLDFLYNTILELKSKQIKKVKSVFIIKDPLTIEKITVFLHKLGISSHSKGFYYLREVVKIMMYNQSLTNKFVFMIIANQFQTTHHRVDCAIRNAINASISQSKTYEIWGELFPKQKVPTNSEVISFVINSLLKETKYKISV